MEAKIMNDDELLANYFDKASPVDSNTVIYGLREVARTQAEISFKAGIKEVVEWIKKNSLKETENADDTGDMLRIIRDIDLQSQLKAWGIKEEK
jgi:hypothetical protein